MKIALEKFQEILDIGIALTKEKNHNKIFEMIIETAMDITNCDGGTLYLYKGEHLYFKIMRTLSLDIYKGGKGEEIDLPPVPLQEGNVCAYSAIHKEVINIEDVYDSDKFDFSGPRKYDAMTGYHTQSMLVVPLENHEYDLIGVLQLMNACDKESGEIVVFDKKWEPIIRSLASQAAVSISNMNYIAEIKSLLYSFVSAFATAVDQRTPYNGSHTRNVTDYTDRFVDYLNEQYGKSRYGEWFDTKRKEELVLAANLHDIGKMVIPLTVMNKSTRLGENLPLLLNRYELLKAYLQLDYFKGKLTQEECDEKCIYLEEAQKQITAINSLGFLTDEKESYIKELALHTYTKEDGTIIPYLTEYERECLFIKKGTLTETERAIMESHAEMTSKILGTIKLNSHYKNVPRWAGAHHEFLDGSGYPNKLKAEEMPAEIRIIALIDIYDALTAKDRPYKNPLPIEKAVGVLKAMVKEGKLDETLVNLFEEFICQSPQQFQKQF